MLVSSPEDQATNPDMPEVLCERTFATEGERPCEKERKKETRRERKKERRKEKKERKKERKKGKKERKKELEGGRKRANTVCILVAHRRPQHAN